MRQPTTLLVLAFAGALGISSTAASASNTLPRAVVATGVWAAVFGFRMVMIFDPSSDRPPVGVPTVT
jgi:hypothetical protein